MDPRRGMTEGRVLTARAPPAAPMRALALRRRGACRVHAAMVGRRVLRIKVRGRSKQGAGPWLALPADVVLQRAAQGGGGRPCAAYAHLARLRATSAAAAHTTALDVHAWLRNPRA